MNNQEILAAVKRYRLIVALRGVELQQIIPTASALYAGGIRMLEVTFDQANPATPQDTEKKIQMLRDQYAEKMLVGAGTVMSVEQVRVAVGAGAQYLLSPNFDSEVLAEARKLGIPMIPGVMTPSEVAGAWKEGAALVKLFPAGTLGMGYIKAISAPMNHIPILGMGGIDENNLTEYLRIPTVVGAGIGSGIVKLGLISSESWSELTALAQKYTCQITD